MLVRNNTIANTQVGVFVGGGIIQSGSNRADVSFNSISATYVFDGIFISGDGHVIKKNVITSTDRTGVFLFGNANRVESNRIQEAAVGIWDFSGTGNTYPLTRGKKNILINVEQNIMGGVVAASLRTKSQTKSAAPASSTTTSHPAPTPVRF